MADKITSIDKDIVCMEQSSYDWMINRIAELEVNLKESVVIIERFYKMEAKRDER